MSSDEVYVALETWTIGDLLSLPRPSFQLAPKESRLKQLREKWDITLLESPTIAMSDETGQIAVAEGKHRIIVAKEKLGSDYRMEGVRHIYGKDAAYVFVELNLGRRRLLGAEVYVGRFSGGYESDLEMTKIAEKYGFKFMPTRRKAVWHLTSATDCRKIYETQNGPYRLDRIFFVISEILNRRSFLPAKDNKWAEGRVIRALDYLLIAFGDRLDLDRLVDKLAPVHPSVAVRYANTRHRANAEALLELYNFKLRSGRLELPPLSEIGG